MRQYIYYNHSNKNLKEIFQNALITLLNSLSSIISKAGNIDKNRTNLNFCKEHGIRLSGKKLGRPKQSETDKKTEYKDNTDRIEVERKFSLAKRKFGLGLLYTKLKNTTEASILLSVIAMNIDRLAAMFVRLIRIFLLYLKNLKLWGY